MTEREPVSELQPLPATAPEVAGHGIGPAVLLVGAGWACLLAGIVALAGALVPGWAVAAVVGGSGLLTAAAALMVWRVFRLEQALSRAHAAQERLAATDAMTGALNHRAFMDIFEREFARSRRYGQQLALMVLDIDFFKRINAGYGHAVGDDALRAFVAALAPGLRNVDAVGRLGGEAFAILLPNTPAESALILADRLRQRVAGIVVRTANDEDVRFTTSIGVTGIAGDDTAAQQMLGRADAALDQAKANGRNRVELAGADQPARQLAAGTDSP